MCQKQRKQILETLLNWIVFYDLTRKNGTRVNKDTFKISKAIVKAMAQIPGVSSQDITYHTFNFDCEIVPKLFF